MIAPHCMAKARSAIDRSSSRRKWAYALVTGAVAALGLAPFDMWFAALLGLAAGFYLFLSAQDTRQSALIGWGFGTGYFAVGLNWIVEPFAVDAARYLWMAPFAMVFMSTGLALFWAAAFWGASLLGKNGSQVVRVLILAVCLSGAELARSYVFTGFPWALVSQIWVQTNVVQVISVLGPHGLTLLTLIAVGFSVVAFSISGWPFRLAALGPAAAMAAIGMYWPDDVPQVQADAPVVRLVQPNAAQRDKWNPAKIPIFFRRQVEFTREPTQSGGRPDLIVWPETAVPTLLDYAGEAFGAIADAAQGAPVVVGIQRQSGYRLFNSMVTLDSQGEVAGLYDKAHLVPFGEYIPFGSVLGQFGLRGMAAKDGNGFSAGPGPVLLDLGPIGRALPLICYEAIFPQDVNAAPERPDFLLQITNDAWFGKFSGPYQHLAQARMRAIEQGLPMMRAANTGVSAMIDARGNITAQLGLDQAGFVDAVLPARLAPTLYSQSGDIPISIVLALALFGFLARNLNARSNK